MSKFNGSNPLSIQALQAAPGNRDDRRRGTAGTIGPDQAVAVAGRELDVDILEQDAFSILQGKVLSTDHCIESHLS